MVADPQAVLHPPDESARGQRAENGRRNHFSFKHLQLSAALPHHGNPAVPANPVVGGSGR